MEEDIRGRLSLGIANFSSLIEQNKIYVDKTRFIKKMLDHGETYYFLSRPRRFGKTLMVSTLESFFQGKKELFKHTYIYDKWDWNEKYPVIHLNMSEETNTSPEKLRKSIVDTLNIISEEKEIEIKKDLLLEKKFSQLIKLLYKSGGKKVVVLIDEYDAPIIDNINNTSLADENREIVQNFYNILKTSEEYIKFVFVTGISKFTKTSIFSKFNNLTELTLDDDYSTICGISHDELKEYYSDHIQVMADKNNYTYEETLERIDFFYDGYSWDGINKVFNPNSTLHSLAQKEFQSFWFSTGTPRFLSEIFKKRKITEDYFTPTLLKSTELDAINPDDINETTLLFQSGYLTVDKKIFENNEFYYCLKIPNFEVEQAYKDNFLKLYIEKFENKFRNSQKIVWDELINGDCKKFSQNLRAFISGIPYYNRISMDNSEKWKVYSMIFTIWAEETDFYLTVEKAIEDGRIDFVLENSENDQTLIIEMKYTANQSKSLDSLINKAFKQIEHKKYWWAYTGEIKIMALALKDIKIDKGFITDVKCKIKDVPKD
ncbi:MAG: AAA family ATPase [Methanobrevibacter sp.]|jgi:hypothetical protein|nr:AAA family ATPase [Methanobrevibacter sp.]